MGVGENPHRTMNSNNSRQAGPPADETPASPPQMPPPNIGRGHPEYHFVESIMTMQKTLGQIDSSIQALTKSIDSTKTKVDALIEWKNRILGGVMVLGAVIALGGFLVSKFSSYVTIKAPESAAFSTQAPALAPSNPPALPLK